MYQALFSPLTHESLGTRLLGVQLLLEISRKAYLFSKVLQFEEGSSTFHLSLDKGGRSHLEKGGGASYIPSTYSLVPRLLVGQEPGYEASTT